MKTRYLELGPELNRHTKAGRYSLEWETCGRSDKTPVDRVVDLDSALPYIDSSFEAVYSSHVLEHLKDPVAFLRECFRVLVPGGVCRVCVPDANWLIHRYLNGHSTIDDLVDNLRSYAPGKHRWGFDRKKLRAVMEMAGFSGLEFPAPGESLLPEMTGVYFSNRSERTIRCEGRRPE